jgi:hypothetical protein
VDLFLSPDGNDQWSGRLPAPTADGTDGPLASPHAARDAARRLRAEEADGPLTIHVASGLYRLRQTLVLGPADGGVPGAPVVWAGHGREPAVFSGGVPVTGWEALGNGEAALPGLPAAAAGEIWTAPLPEGVEHPRALFDGEGLLTRAHSEDFATEDREGVTDDTTLCFAPGSLPCRPRAEMELFLKPNHPWVVNSLPVAEVDEEQGVLKTAIRATYDLTSGMGWKIIAGTCRLENVPEGLTGPGTWFVDVAARRLYLWPRRGGEPRDVEASALTELVRVAGDEGAEGAVRHLGFSRLTLERADRWPWPAERIAAQHDWEIYDAPTALLRLRGAEEVTVRDCTFRHSGGGGVRLDGHCVACAVEYNECAGLGGSGVALLGCLPGRRDESHHNRVVGNHIHHIGRLLWHSAGILLSQSGSNRVAENRLHHLPYSGIVLVSGREAAFGEAAQKRADPGKDGRGGAVCWDEVGDCPPESAHRIGLLTCKWNLVEHNDIYACMETLGDGNGIYISGTGVGNVARRNFVHDIAGQGCQSAVRFDDKQWHCRVAENVIARVSGGGITMKHVNDIEDNVVVDCARWGSILIRRAPAWGAQIRRNILVQSGRPFPEGADGGVPPFYDGKRAAGPEVDQPVIDDNLLWCTEEPQAAERCLATMREHGQEARTVVADPGFEDPAHNNFRLRTDSRARRLGFRSLETYGLTGAAGPRTHFRLD